MADRLFGTNGVRGVVNEQMDIYLAMNLGRAIGTFMGGDVAVGSDSRTSAAMLRSALAAGVMSAGSNVIDLGLVPTPVVQYYVKKERTAGGVMITASHNPPEFNGIKCIDADGTEMPREKEERIEQLYFSRDFTPCDWSGVGRSREESNAVAAYLQGIERLVDVEAIRRRELTVVLDCANGAGTVATPALLQDLGVRAITLNCTPLGTFPGHPSEPVESHLKDLISMVKESGADMGIAHDGDADRTIFIDDKGRYMYGDKSLAIVSEWMVRQENGGIVVTPVSTSQCVEDMVTAAGGAIIYTRVGSPVVARKMMEVGAVFGGEENGGLIFPLHQYCRDGAMTVAAVLEIVSKSGPLSKLVDRIPRYFLEKRKMHCPESIKEEVLERLGARFEGQKVDITDGVKIFYEEGWALVRPSGTEPLFRIFAEGRTEKSAKRHAEECEGVLREIVSKAGG
jgi:phosphomannomutase/phosphoglucomutase